MSKSSEVTVDDVVAGLLAEAEGKRDSTPSSRAAAWSHLGQHLGMDRRNIKMKIEYAPAEVLSDAELVAELIRVRAVLAAIEGII